MTQPAAMHPAGFRQDAGPVAIDREGQVPVCFCAVNIGIGRAVYHPVGVVALKERRYRVKAAYVDVRVVADCQFMVAPAGADYILVTCSSIGPAVETAATLTGVPVLRVDQPMVDKAVEMGTKIGVVATLPTTLEPTSDLVRRRAMLTGKEIELTSRLCEGAFDALMGGNPEIHDEKVATALKELARDMDVILLAQASMARVVDQLSEEDKKVPIITSPDLAVQYLAGIL